MHVSCPRHEREAEQARQAARAAGAQQQQAQEQAGQELPARAKTKLRRERWCSFVRDQTRRRQPPPSWKQLGEIWATLDEDTKDSFAHRREVAAPVQPTGTPAASTSPASWSAWGLGSEAWPLSTVYAEEISRRQLLSLIRLVFCVPAVLIAWHVGMSVYVCASVVVVCVCVQPRCGCFEQPLGRAHWQQCGADDGPAVHGCCQVAQLLHLTWCRALRLRFD